MDAYLTKHIFGTVARQQYRDQFPEMIRMNQAFGKMLVRQGLLKEEAFENIYAGLERVAESLKESDLREERLDLYFNVMDRLYEEVGRETGELLHVGRSRNDMGSTCYHMQVRKAIWRIAELMNQGMEALLEAAKEQADTVITYNTYGQPAQPGSLGHYLMGAFALLERDYVRLTAAYRNTNRCPLGAAAGMGTAYPVDRDYLSELLGFDGVMEHSLDAVASVDYLLETETVLAMLMSDISRITQDLLHWSSEESRILQFDAEVSTGSSIMPQKRNPVCLENMRARTANALGLLTAGLSLCRNTSLFPSNDATPYLFVQFGQAVEEAEKPLELFRLTWKHCIVNRERAYEAARTNYTFATALAEYLALNQGIPFSQTHHVVRGIVMRLLEQEPFDTRNITGELVAELSQKELGYRIDMTDQEIRQILDPRFCMNYRVTAGSAGTEETWRLIAEGEKKLQEQKKWLAEAKGKVDNAYARLRCQG